MRQVVIIAIVVLLAVVGHVLYGVMQLRIPTDKPFSVLRDCHHIQAPFSLKGSEDFEIDHKTGLVWFSQCDHQMVGQHRQPGRWPSSIFTYDLRAKEFNRIKVLGLDEHDLCFHGISLNRDQAGVLRIFAIDHGNNGTNHGVRIFTYDDYHHTLTEEHHVQSEFIVSPNDLKAVGSTEFYVGNDHGFGASIRPLALLFDFLQLPLSYLTHCRIDNGVKCTPVAEHILMVNGVNVSPNGKQLFLAACTAGKVQVYDRDIPTGRLTYNREIYIGGAVDNLDFAPDGSLFIATHPSLLEFLAAFQDLSGNTPAPTGVFRLKAPAYDTLELIHLSKGDDIAAASTAAEFESQVLITSVYDGKLLQCKI